MSEKKQDEPLLLVSRADDVVVLTLNQPARRNALAWKMLEQLTQTLQELHADAAVRCIVLTGAGGHFCAGGDISEMAHRTMQQSRLRLNELAVLVRRLAAGPKPVVAAVEGACAGAGLSIAALCDYVVASRSARFCAAFMRVGLIPDIGGFWSIQQRVGRAKAREICSLARTYDGTEAARIGLVNDAVDAGGALERAMQVAREYAAMPPTAMAMLRTAFVQDIDSLEVALRAEVDYQCMLRETADHREAVSAFMEKRSPRFVGG